MNHIEEIQQEINSVLLYMKQEGLYEKTNKRIVVYRRAYLFQYLNNVLRVTHEVIAENFSMNASSISYNQNKIYGEFANDEMFITITQKEHVKFPMSNKEKFDQIFFRHSKGKKRIDQNKIQIVIELPHETLLELRLLKINNKFSTLSEAIEYLINQYNNSKK